MSNKDRALTLIDELKDRGAINNREVGTLRRAILLNDLLRELKNCRNELCYRCGQYANAHLGACDGCRWSDERMKRWEDKNEE